MYDINIKSYNIECMNGVVSPSRSRLDSKYDATSAAISRRVQCRHFDTLCCL